MLIRTPSEPVSTSFFFGNHANALPATLNAGKPYVVPSSTSGSFVAIARTRARLSRFMRAKVHLEAGRSNHACRRHRFVDIGVRRDDRSLLLGIGRRGIGVGGRVE